ncbi:hypothetical protein ABT115_13775 [Streptomyces sp. NPDC001832]|uniref:hypothetical protein n=1 Tax=Streptomyces sp. NPDC001832 TaxID=3154527 RepID=UPI003319338D
MPDPMSDHGTATHITDADVIDIRLATSREVDAVFADPGTVRQALNGGSQLLSSRMHAASINTHRYPNGAFCVADRAAAEHAKDIHS